MPGLTFKAYDARYLSESEIEKICHTLTKIAYQLFISKAQKNNKDHYDQTYNYYFDRLINKEHFFNRVEILESNNQAVGYTYVYVRTIRIDSGKKFNVAGGEIGILPGYRGNNFTMSSSIRHGKSYYAENLCLSDKTFYFGEAFNPITYHVLCKHMPMVYPRPDSEASDEMKQLYNKLLEVYNIKLVSPWVSINMDRIEPTGGELKVMQKSDSPYVKFFLVNNPNYVQGFVMPLLVQSGAWDMMYAGGVFFKEYVNKQILSFFGKNPNSHMNDTSATPLHLAKAKL